jgi:hypothetical protein
MTVASSRAAEFHLSSAAFALHAGANVCNEIFHVFVVPCFAPFYFLASLQYIVEAFRVPHSSTVIS